MAQQPLSPHLNSTQCHNYTRSCGGSMGHQGKSLFFFGTQAYFSNFLKGEIIWFWPGIWNHSQATHKLPSKQMTSFSQTLIDTNRFWKHVVQPPQQIVSPVCWCWESSACPPFSFSPPFTVYSKKDISAGLNLLQFFYIDLDRIIWSWPQAVLLPWFICSLAGVWGFFPFIW